MTQVILYVSEDGKSRIQLCADGQTVWLTQMEMAELFSATKQIISLHLRNRGVERGGNCQGLLDSSKRGGAREVRRSLTLSNLDAILTVGCCVLSPRGVQLRRWMRPS